MSKKFIITKYGEYTPEQLIQVIKNNGLKLTTSLRNDDASPLVRRLNILRETRELTRIALSLGIKSPEINRTMRILGINDIIS
jgi:hypothetical protein